MMLLPVITFVVLLIVMIMMIMMVMMVMMVVMMMMIIIIIMVVVVVMTTIYGKKVRWTMAATIDMSLLKELAATIVYRCIDLMGKSCPQLAHKASHSICR